jgi:hypothetical protein
VVSLGTAAMVSSTTAFGVSTFFLLARFTFGCAIMGVFASIICSLFKLIVVVVVVVVVIYEMNNRYE